MKSFRAYIFITVLFFASGCASMTRTAPSYEAAIEGFKTIAVMPVDITMYQLSAGGQQEEIDEWTIQATDDISRELKKNIEQKKDFTMKFIEEDWLKNKNEELWRDQKALYEAVSLSAMRHAYKGSQANEQFSTKKDNFDYTLGSDLKALTALVDADALLFVYGYDHEATSGRQALSLWYLVWAGVPLPNPTFLSLGLVNGQTGNIEWFKVTGGQSEYSFRKEKHIEKLIEWITKDFIIEEKEEESDS